MSGIVLSEQELRSVDAQYRPFAKLEEWLRVPLRADAWEAGAAELERLRSRASAKDLDKALSIVMRAAALDTGGIERLYPVSRGFTITVATQAAAWETRLAELDAAAPALFAAQLHTYELVLDAATKRLPVTEALIRRLHEELCAPQATYEVVTAVGVQEQPLPKGEYKRYPNHVRLADGSFHAYAPVNQTASEMHRLVAALASAEFSVAHPIAQAAFAHHALAAIHPFADGNGRVARALASVYFYRAARIPLLLFADRRLEYFDALEAADADRYEAFLEVVADAGITAMDVVTQTLRAARAPDPGELVERLQGLIGIHEANLDRAGNQLTEQLGLALGDLIGELPASPSLSIYSFAKRTTLRPAQHGYRGVHLGPNAVEIRAATSQPVALEAETIVHTLVSESAKEPATFAIVWPDGTELTTFALRDVAPELTAAAMFRVRALAQLILSRFLERLERDARNALDASD